MTEKIKCLLKLANAFRGALDSENQPRDEKGRYAKTGMSKRKQKTRPIKLSRKEYAKVMHNLNTHLSDEEKQKDALQKCIGDYLYIIQNNGFNNYVILGRIKLK